MAEAKKTTKAKAKTPARSTAATGRSTEKTASSLDRAAETDAARAEARVARRDDLRGAQRLDQGEEDRQKARAELAKAAKTPQPTKTRELSKPQ
jgi:hypothetical protein